MNFFWFLVVVVLVVWVIGKIKEFMRVIDSLRRSVADLEGRLRLLERRIGGEKKDKGEVMPPEVQIDEEIRPLVEEAMRSFEYQAEEEMKKQTVEVTPADVSAAMLQTAAIADLKGKTLTGEGPSVKSIAWSYLSDVWSMVERRFAENWTGILGSMIMVMGISFLGIYTALKMAPFYRFLLMVLVAGFFGGMYFFLRARPKWRQLASWLRSSGGAVLMFACVGAGGIPGLQWADNAMTALILLIAGVAVNSYLAYIGGAQVFASLHVLLSLVALAIAPANAISLVVACIVTLIGISITYKEQWEYHLLLTIGLFFAFHLYWYLELGADSIIGTLANIAGIAAVLTVGVAALLVHYREIYSTDLFARVPFLVHFFNWAFMGFGLYLHSTGSKWKPLIIAAGAIAAFVLARLARAKGIRWLYMTDTLVAQVIALVALITVNGWGVHWIYILGFVFIECSIFLYIMIREKERILGRAGAWLTVLAGVAMLAIAFSASIDETGGNAVLHRYALSLMICALWAAAMHIVFIQRNLSLEVPIGMFYFPYIYYSFTGVFLSGIVWELKPLLYFVLVFLSFITAKWAKTKDMRRIFPSACVFSQITATLGVYSLGSWGVGTFYLMGLAFVESLLFYHWMMKEETTSIWGFANFWAVMSGVILVFPGIMDALDQPAKHWRGDEISITLLGAALAAILFYMATKATGFQRPELKAISWLAPLMLLAVYVKVVNLEGAGYTFALLGTGILAIRQRYDSRHLGLASLFFLAGFHLAGWAQIDLALPLPVTTIVLNFIPLFALAFACYKLSYSTVLNRFVRRPGIYLLGTNTLLFFYYLLEPVSTFLPALAWLAAGVGLIAAADAIDRRLKDKIEREGYTGRYMLHVGNFLVGAFLIRHFAAHIASGQLIGGIKIKVIIAAAGIVALSYLALRKRGEFALPYKSREILAPLYLELCLLFIGVTVVMEARPEWQPLLFSLLALVALKSNRLLPQWVSRLKFYSILFFWTSGLLVVLNAMEFISPHTHWHEAVWLCSAGTLILQFIFSILVAPEPALARIEFPLPVRFFSNWLPAISSRKNPWIYYPLFAVLALFLYFSFDKALLTLLWVVECFIIFILGLVLKENHFRIVSMSGLGLALIRLVFSDMAKTETLARALVFIGVGVIMLSMNSLYNKYKDRF